MVQTSFTAADGTSLATVLLDIGSGTDAAINTSYTITMTAPIDAASETVSLEAGSTVTLDGSFPFIINAFTVTGSVIADLNFTGTIDLDNGAFDNVALTTNGGGTIVAGEYTGAVLGTEGDAGDSAVNSGTIGYGGSYAAVEFAGGTVQNGWNGPTTALISGVAGGVALTSGGLVRNGGTIIASGTSAAAVFMAAGTVDNGQIGNAGALISGGENGVEVTGAGTVANDGTIEGTASDAVYLGSGTVTNGQIGDATALISGGPDDNGVWIGTGLGTVGNFGTIIGGGASGVLLAAGGAVTNAASASIAGAVDGVLLLAAGTLFNSGTIEGDGSDAVHKVIGAFLENGGSIGNETTASVIGGVDWGAIVEGASGTVTNLGTIDASGTAGLGLDLSAGGTVVNGLSAGAAATISGAFDGVRISKGAQGAGVVVQNDGTIGGSVGVDFATGPTPAAGTLTNDGLIESTAGTSGFAVEFGTGSETLVLQPAGAFIGHVLGDNATSSSTVLELAAGTQGTLSGPGNDGGTVTDGAGSFVFSAIGTIQLDTGASWTVLAPGTLDTVVNNGALGVSGGSVTVSGSLANNGGISIANATLSTVIGVLTDSGVITVDAGGLLQALGGGITAAGTAALAVGGGSPAALYVTGAGATVNTNGERIAIGSSGLGSALISQGGTVLAGTPFAADEAVAIGEVSGATGTLTVTDPGSRLGSTGQLSVGLGGAGSLLVGNQATVTAGGDTVDASEGTDIGQLAGAVGQAEVTGTDSLLSNTGRFVVGDAGLGSLQIQSGGTVITSPGTVSGLAGLVIANTASAAGSSVNLSGAGSNLQITGLLDVGGAGSGALDMSGGASLVTGSFDAGVSAAAVGQIGLSGAGTGLSISGAATVADAGTGVLSILSGATFSAASLTIGATKGSSGAVIVSGAGSDLTVSGVLNIGSALGAGDLTVGPSAAVHASVINLEGQVVLEGGLLDPSVTVINPNKSLGGSGTVASGDIIDEGILQAGDGTPGQLELVQGTIVGGGTLTENGSKVANKANAAGVLQINTFGTMEVDGAVLNASTTTFANDVTPTTTYTVTHSVIDVNFEDSTGVLQLDDIAGFGGTIATFQAGDQFIITGGTLSGLGVNNGTTLTMSDTGNGGTDQIIFNSQVSASYFNIVAGNTIDVVACFAAGTRIETETGLMMVESLRAGDRVITDDGTCEPIVWIGHRTIDCARHPKPETVWPVRVLAGAFGMNVPERDLYLSPDHAIFVNNVLVPVKFLIDGTSIAQLKRAEVSYYHVELPRHAVILAEGLTVESYLDLGDRADFNQAGKVIRLFPDFGSSLTPDAAMVWETKGAAPLVQSGPELVAARRTVTRNARPDRSAIRLNRRRSHSA